MPYVYEMRAIVWPIDFGTFSFLFLKVKFSLYNICEDSTKGAKSQKEYIFFAKSSLNGV